MPTEKSPAIAIVNQYSRMSCDDMRLMFGELTASEIRTIRAVLQAIIRDVNNEQDKESNR